jgi:hypothetical protein
LKAAQGAPERQAHIQRAARCAEEGFALRLERQGAAGDLEYGGAILALEAHMTKIAGSSKNPIDLASSPIEMACNPSISSVSVAKRTWEAVSVMTSASAWMVMSIHPACGSLNSTFRVVLIDRLPDDRARR